MIAPIALTSGDPNGVGLDLLDALCKNCAQDHLFFLIADKSHVATRLRETDMRLIGDPRDARLGSHLNLLHHEFPELPTLDGPHYANAQATIDVIERAVEFTQSGTASAVCTNPINKAVLAKGAGFSYPGHTEFLAHLGDVDQSVMMLANADLRTVPLTIHHALADIPNMISQELIIQTVHIIAHAMKQDFGIDSPRIWVAGLNPHAGEGGKFGLEDEEIIRPAIAQLSEDGIAIEGPYSADTMFHQEARANYDVALCMYHDQALIPVKTLDFHGGVNVTLGLPFIRTSPDHGTAYGLAGSNKANASSLIAAIKMAHQMAGKRNG